MVSSRKESRRATILPSCGVTLRQLVNIHGCFAPSRCAASAWASSWNAFEP